VFLLLYSFQISSFVEKVAICRIPQPTLREPLLADPLSYGGPSEGHSTPVPDTLSSFFDRSSFALFTINAGEARPEGDRTTPPLPGSPPPSSPKGPDTGKNMKNLVNPSFSFQTRASPFLLLLVRDSQDAPSPHPVYLSNYVDGDLQVPVPYEVRGSFS